MGTINTYLLKRAIEIAHNAHWDQLDKAGQPYILHPLQVMLWAPTLEQKIVAVLHDTVEDTNVTLDFLSTEFPKEIVDAVDAISKRKGESKPDYYARIKSNPLALAVKLLDMKHNSSEERLLHLPESEQIYLREKYRKAFNVLLDRPISER